MAVSVETTSDNESETFCILPFIHAATLTDGQMPLCCVSEKTSGVNLNSETISDHWNSSHMKSVRKNMLAGKKVKECRRCYEEEENGYRSHRVIENKAWKEKIGEEQIDKIIERVQADGETQQGVIAVDLRLGNTCNLQCVMCQPRESSKWKGAGAKFLGELRDKSLVKEWKYKNDIKVEQFEWYRNQSFWANLKEFLPTLREIIVGGGEPMLIKEHLQFIKECAESGEAHHIHLRYHTNMTVFPEDMIPYWEKFERVEFFSSIDGMGDVGHYVRYPAKWKLVEDNIRKIDALGDNITLRLLYSVNALNIHHLPDFVRWVKEQKFRKETQFTSIQSFVHPGLVHWPEYLNVKVLPKDYKEWVTKEVELLREEFPDEPFDKYEGIVQFMNSQDWSNKLPQFNEYVRVLDKTRGTDFYSVFPDLSESVLSL